MYRKGLGKSKQIAAFLLAGAMIFGNTTVFAQEGNVDLSEQTSVQTASEEVSFTDRSYPAECMTGKTDYVWITLGNAGAEEINLSDYEFRVRGTKGTEAVTLKVNRVTGDSIQPGENTGTIEVGYTIPEDMTEPVVKFVVDIYAKDNPDTPVYTTEEVTVYPYQIVETAEGNVLRYIDTTQGEKYEIKVKTGEHITFTGLIGGGGGDATEIWEETPSGTVECTGIYLRPGYASSFGFEADEGYVLGTPKLTPADAGVIQRPVGSNFCYTVDIHKPAVLEISGEPETVMEDASGIKFVADATDLNSEYRSVLSMDVQDYTDEETIAYVRENIEPVGEIQAYSVKMALSGAIGDEYSVNFEGTDPRLYIPVPEGWDKDKLGFFVITSQGDKTFVYESSIEKFSSDGKYIIYTPWEFSNEFHDAEATFGIFQKSSATEAKIWKNIAQEFITNIRYVNWGSQLTFEDYFFDFEEELPANAAGMITRQMEMENYTESYRVGDSYTLNIPYDVFVKDAAKYMKNVPDLKKCDMEMFLYYDETKNVFVVPEGGVGDELPVITDVKTEELGNDTYGIRFHFDDRGTYESDATLVVEDNGQGEWRYLAFLKGHPELEPVVPEEPDQPEEPGQPEEPDQPGTSEDTLVNPNPGSELSQEFIGQVQESLESAVAGSEVVIEMKGATKVPSEVLNTVKGKDVDIVLEMGTYTWTINGKSVTADLKSDVDLKVTIDTDVIPENILEKAADGNPAIQLSIAHDGSFGFQAELSICAGEEYNEKTAKLYYYNEEDGDLEFVQESTVDSDGFVVYTFEHASDYAIVIETKNEEDENQKPGAEDTEQGSDTGNANQKPESDPSDKTPQNDNIETTEDHTESAGGPDTGDSSDIGVYVMTFLSAGGVMVFFGKRKLWK